MPKRGESATQFGFEFKVLRASSRRIHLLEVTRAKVTEVETDNLNDDSQKLEQKSSEIE